MSLKKMNDVIDAASEMSPLVSTCTVVGGSDMFRGLLQAVVALPISNLSHDQEQRCHVVGGFYDSKHQRSELHWLHGRLPGTCTPVKLNQWRNCSPWIDGRVRTMCLLWEQELLLCSSDSETRLFRLRDGFELLGPGSLPSLTSSCELRKGLFAGGDRNGLVSVWTMRCFTEATSPSKFRNSLMPARKGDVSTVRVTSSAALRLHDKPITSLVVLSEGLLLSGSKDRCVALWSVSQEGEGSAISAWRKHNAPITCLSAVTIQRSESSTLRFAVSGDESGCVRSWNLNSKQPQGYAQLQQPKYAGGQASISVTALFQPGTSLPLFGVGDSCCRIHLFDAIKGFFVATFDVNSMMEPPIGKLLPCGPTMIVGKRRLTSIGIGEVWLPTFQGNGILPPTAILGRKARPLPSLQPLPEDHAGATNSPRASTETDTAPHSPTSTKSQGPVRGVSTLRPTELASNRDLQPANVSLISMESDPTRVVEPIEPSSHYIESTTTDPIAVKPLVTDPQRRILDTRVPNQTRPDSKQSTPIRSSQPERTAVTGSDPMDGIRRLALEVRNHPPSASDEDLSTLLRLLKKVEREHGIMATRSPAGVTKLGGPSNTKTSGDLLEAKESACQEPDSYTMKNVSDTRPLPPNKLPEATVRRPTAVNAPDTAEEDLSVTLRQRTTIDYAEQAKNDEDVPASISEVPPVVDIEPKTIPRKHPNDNDMKASPIDIPPKSSDGLSTLEKQTSPTKSLKKDSSLVCTKKGDAVADVSEKLVSTSDMKSKSHGAGPTSPDRIGQLRARARAKVQSGLSLQRRDLSALWGNAFQLPTRTAERKVLAPTRGLPIRKDAGDVPGPGLYPVKSEFDQNLRRSRGFSFAKRSSSVERPRPAHRKDTPAPGSYNLPSSFEESLRHKKGFTMGRATERLTKRHNRAKDDSDLGPGVYGPGPSEFDRFVDPQRSRGFTIAPRRDRQPKKHGPDPGSYEVKGFADEAREKGRGFSFHSSEAQMTGSSSKYRSKSCPKARPGAKDDSHIPGPGAYWTDLRTSAPAFSFGRKFESRPDETPGPGYYDPQTEATIPKAPEYSVAQRIEEVIDPIPGPTHYNPEYSYVCSGAPSFSMGRRLEANLRQAPGPADYDTNVSMRMTLGAGPAYSIGLPFEPPTDNNPIGPGYYEHKGLAEDNAGKGFTMYARLEDPVSDSPGPGTYDSEQRTNAPSFSFGQKLYDPTNDLPGPGSYDVDGCFGVDSKGKTIGLPLSSSVEQTPGPGDYCYSGNDVSVEASRKDFTMGERIALKPIEGPGPGAYEHHYLMSESVGKGFTMYPKLSTPTSDVPGPGTYDSRGSFEGTRSITIGKRLSEVVQQTPAPGDYNTTSEFDSANKGVSIGLPLEHGVSETPGPGTYSIPSDLERSGKGVSFGIRLEDSVNDTPGPGTYDAEQESWAGPGKGVSIGLPLDSKPQDTPGPGAYSSDAQTVADEAQKKGNTMGYRIETAPKEGPGPGAYEHEVRQHASKGFTMYPKLDTTIPETPGPGTYDVSCSFDAPEHAGFTIGLRHSEPSNENPGPGTYDTRTSFDAKKGFTMGGLLYEPQKDTPAPGDYDAGSEFDPSGKRGVTIGLPHSHPGTKNENPGPGDYSVTREFDVGGKGVTIGLPLSSSVLEGPGPGQYDVSRSFENDRKGVTIGLPRAEHVNETPGPGDYSVEERGVASEAERKRFTIGARLETAPKEGPGPGTYDHSIVDKDVNKGFTMYQKLSTPTPDYPGPGTYDARSSDFGGTKGISMGSLLPQNPDSIENPGPGTYRPENALQRIQREAPAHSFGERVETPVDKPLVGPGDYDLSLFDLAYGLQTGPSFGRSARDPSRTSGDQGPGPGHYEAYEPGSNAPYGSFAKNKGHEFAKPVDGPGPGEYDSSHFPFDASLQKGAVFGTGVGHVDRTPREENRTPGPGMYEQPGTFSTTSEKGFTMYGRIEMPTKPTPGPGEYDSLSVSQPRSPKGPSFARAVVQETADPTPGPGWYEAKGGFGGSDSKQQGFSMYSKLDVPIKPSPGPGEYNVSDPRLRADAGPTFSHGPGHTPLSGSNTTDLPGPGMYESTGGISDSLDKKKGFTMYERLSAPTRDTPGPGEYEIIPYEDHSRVKGPTFGLSLRHVAGSPQKEPVPGPGSYETPEEFRNDSGKQKGFTMYSKLDFPIRPSPGPGEYDAPPPGSHAGAAGPTFSRAAAHDTAPKEEHLPGPGWYEHGGGMADSLSPKRGFTMYPKIEVPVKPSPGPGWYETAPVSEATKAKGPSFGRAPAHDGGAVDSDVNPGPGSYETRGGISDGLEERKGFTMYPKIEVPVKPSPGPGWYETAPVSEATKAKGPSFGRAPAHDGGAVDSDVNPGPGSYETRGGISDGLEERKGFTMYPKIESPVKPSPGPGWYETAPVFEAAKAKGPSFGRAPAHDGG
eukprot:Rmarinus@m.20633